MLLDDGQLRLLDRHRARVADRVAEVALAAGVGDPAETVAGVALLTGPAAVQVSLGVWCVLAQAEGERAFRGRIAAEGDGEGERRSAVASAAAEAVPGALLRRLQPRLLPFTDAEVALMLDLSAPWSVEALEFAVAAAEGLIARGGSRDAITVAAERARRAFDRRPLGRPMRIRRLAARLAALAA